MFAATCLFPRWPLNARAAQGRKLAGKHSTRNWRQLALDQPTRPNRHKPTTHLLHREAPCLSNLSCAKNRSRFL